MLMLSAQHGNRTAEALSRFAPSPFIHQGRDRRPPPQPPAVPAAGQAFHAGSPATGMDCPDCGAGTVAFAVPDGLDTLDEPAAALCTHCLALHSVEKSDANSDFTAVSDDFPTGSAAVPMALAIGLLDSLVLHRETVEALLERVERAGTDPLLVIDRLANDPTLDPKTDLATRRRQVAQLRD